MNEHNSQELHTCQWGNGMQNQVVFFYQAPCGHENNAKTTWNFIKEKPNKKINPKSLHQNTHLIQNKPNKQYTEAVHLLLTFMPTNKCWFSHDMDFPGTSCESKSTRHPP